MGEWSEQEFFSNSENYNIHCIIYPEQELCIPQGNRCLYNWQCCKGFHCGYYQDEKHCIADDPEPEPESVDPEPVDPEAKPSLRVNIHYTLSNFELTAQKSLVQMI